MANLKKSGSPLASQQPPEIFEFRREDWALFRTVEGLQQKAGVSKDLLRRLILKELADNGLDNDARVAVGQIDGGYFVEDDGPGIDGTPEQIASLFSIARPMLSSKLWRLPTRGALGNGLRVVAGGVLASDGSLTVTTRDKRLVLRPEFNGTTTVVSVEPVDTVGTRIEIGFGPALPEDTRALEWARTAIAMRGKSYAGSTSPHWYDSSAFRELLLAAGSRPVRELIVNLDGCSGKAAEIIAAARLPWGVTCSSVTREQSGALLRAACRLARPVNPNRLLGVGPTFDTDSAYASKTGNLNGVPFLVEAWARPARGKTTLSACVNRTPVTGSVKAWRDKREINAHGCGLNHRIAEAPKDKQFHLRVNVITPHMPLTSDGKLPNLEAFFDPIAGAVSSAVRKAHIPSANGTSQKTIVLEHLDEAITKVSDNGRYRFNQRQLFYALRPIIREETGKDLTIGNFNGIITDYEADHGEIPGMYREPRGSIYHPHRKETITLGTLMVEEYERPVWTFNKVVYIEKEGFSEALKDARWAERHDCMLMSSKGFSTRAARDLIDKLAEHDEPVTIFCVHDADAYGTMIFQTFQEATKARGARKINVVNLGLEPWEARAMGLEEETVEEKDRGRPVADYVRERDGDDEDWEEWLQTRRVELNAMTTPQFIEWLDGKMAAYGKLIPPVEVLEKELADRIEKKVRAETTERILREANFEDQVAAAVAAISKPTGDVMAKEIEELFRREPEREWRDHIKEIASKNTD
jgi:hypothetical protein